MTGLSENTKVCSKCGERQDLTFFNKDCTRADGLYPQCKACSRASCRKTYFTHHEKHMVMKRKWKAENPERHAAINREWSRGNAEKVRGYVSKWKAANPDDAKRHIREYQERRRVATPPWADRKAMCEFYAARPEGCHVDHIIPLKGANVCGLNVPWNLQYLPIDEHQRKGATVPDMWSNELV